MSMRVRVSVAALPTKCVISLISYIELTIYIHTWVEDERKTKKKKIFEFQ